MYYALILFSVMIFGGCFGLDDLYQRHRGSGIRISMEYALTSAQRRFRNAQQGIHGFHAAQGKCGRLFHPDLLVYRLCCGLAAALVP